MTGIFSDNAKENRFEYKVGDHIAYADYRREGKTLFIDYVFSPDELRGTGAAGKLMQLIVEAAQKDGSNIVPICGYAVSWLRKNQKPPTP
ncbi:MAG: GNAT family N-acetyltransferase [Alphaproteobacteria bacterium]